MIQFVGSKRRRLAQAVHALLGIQRAAGGEGMTRPGTGSDTGRAASLRRAAVRSVVPLVVLAALGWLVWSNWQQIRDQHWELNLAWAAAGFVLYSGSLLASSLLWHSIVVDLAGDHSYWRGAQACAIAMVARRVPGGPWGVVSRAYIYHRAGYSWGVPLTASVLELAANGLATLWLSGLLLVLQPFEIPAIGWIGAAALGAGSLVTLYPPALRWVLATVGRRTGRDLSLQVSIRLARVLLWVAVAGLGWLLKGLMLYCLVLAIAPVQAPMLTVLRGWIVANAACLGVIFLPSGFGLLELTLAALLSTGLPTSVAVAAPLAARLFTTISDAILAGLAWRVGNLQAVRPPTE